MIFGIDSEINQSLSVLFTGRICTTAVGGFTEDDIEFIGIERYRNKLLLSFIYIHVCTTLNMFFNIASISNGDVYIRFTSYVDNVYRYQMNMMNRYVVKICLFRGRRFIIARREKETKRIAR